MTEGNARFSILRRLPLTAVEGLYEEINSIVGAAAPGAGPDTKVAPRTNEITVVDRAALMEVIRGDMDFLKELTDDFVQQYPEQLSESRRAAAAGDTGKLARLAHSIKGGIGAIRGTSAYEAAARLEELARNGDSEKVPIALDALEAEMELLRTELELLCRWGPERPLA